jgi:hypothetical protein
MLEFLGQYSYSIVVEDRPLCRYLSGGVTSPCIQPYGLKLGQGPDGNICAVLD